MTEEILIRSEGDNFLVKDPRFGDNLRQIPKNNYRDLVLDERAIVSDDRKIDISVSSDTPYKRWWYYEILGHSKDEIDLSRMNDGAMSLFNHKRDDYVGVIEKAWIDDGKLYNTIRFGTHQRAEEIIKAINEGIFKNVSIGYRVNELVLVKKSDDDLNTYKATNWTPFESSFVTVPADATVGVGRQYYDLSSSQGTEISGEVKEVTPDWEKLNQKVDLVVSTVDDFINQERDMPDLVVDEKDIRSQERERISVINAQAKKYGCPEIAEKAIADGMTIEQARALMADKVLGRSEETQKPVGKTLNPVDLPNNDAKRYSFLKAIGFAAGKLKAEQCGLELEVSDHIQNTRMGDKPPEGIYVDQTRLVSYRAPYDTGTPAAAGNLISTDLLADRFIEALYNQSAFLSAGVTYMRDLTGNVEIPRESTFTNGYWIGEGQAITEDEGTFDKITMSPKKLACLSKITYEMINQSSIDLERLMRARLIRGLALELDRTIGFGSGIAEEPLGIASHPEVLSIVLGANGAALDWAGLINMQAEIDNANAMMGGSFCYVVNSRTKAKLMQTLDNTTGSGSWIWRNNMQAEGTIAGYQAKCSNQIPNNLLKGTATNLTAAFFGDFSNVLLGIWSGLDVMVDPYSESSNAIIKVIAKQLADIQLTRGDYFCVATDVQNN
ncbi:MAG: phage major capsid protein [Cyanobacteria bacterium J06623_7]